MSATYQQAVDDMFGLVRTAWNSDSTIDWEAVPGEVPFTDVPWIRPTIRHTPGGQASLADGTRKRRWRRNGILWIQLFVPSGSGLSKAYELAKILTDAIEGTSTEHCVWFRNTRINEIGRSGAFNQLNVLTDFTYDEIK